MWCVHGWRAIACAVDEALHVLGYRGGRVCDWHDRITGGWKE